MGIFNQTFRSCRFETLRNLGIVNPGRNEQGGTETVGALRFDACYVENWGRPLLLGKIPNLEQRPDADRWLSGAGDSPGRVSGVVLTGGHWNNEHGANQSKVSLGPNVDGFQEIP